MSADISYGIDAEKDAARSSTPLLLSASEQVTLNYDPASVLPGETPGSYQVDVLLYSMDVASGEWEELEVILMSTPNSGSLSISLPEVLTNSIHPIAFFIGTSTSASTSSSPSTVQALRQSGLRAGIFSSVLYYSAHRTSLESTRQSACDSWYNNPSSGATLSQVPCPCILEQAALPTSGFELMNFTSIFGRRGYHLQWQSTFHPGAQACYQQVLVLDRR